MTSASVVCGSSIWLVLKSDCYRGMVVYQLQLTKSRDAVPLTRDYILDWERQRYERLHFRISDA